MHFDIRLEKVACTENKEYYRNFSCSVNKTAGVFTLEGIILPNVSIDNMDVSSYPLKKKYDDTSKICLINKYVLFIGNIFSFSQRRKSLQNHIGIKKCKRWLVPIAGRNIQFGFYKYVSSRLEKAFKYVSTLSDKTG